MNGKKVDNLKLRFGPYDAPATHRGARLFCEIRGTVVVGGYSAGPIPWRYALPIPARSGGTPTATGEHNKIEPAPAFLRAASNLKNMGFYTLTAGFILCFAALWFSASVDASGERDVLAAQKTRSSVLYRQVMANKYVAPLKSRQKAT